MRIARVESVRIRRDLGDAVEPGARMVLRISTDDDVVGWGEGPTMETPDAWAAALREVARLVQDADPRRRDAIVQRLRGERLARTGVGAAMVAALDVALHDLLARTLDVPTYELLGGLYRERIPVYCALPPLDPLDQGRGETDLEAAIASTIGKGFRRVKVRVSGGAGADIQQDWIEASARLVGLVRQRLGPEGGIIVDVGKRSNTAEVVRLARELEALDIDWLDLSGLSPLGLRSVADHVRVRLCHGASLDRRGLLPYLEAHATDIVAVAPALHGLAESRRMTDLAAHFDAMFCAPEAVGPLGMLANVQLCAAMPSCEVMGIDGHAWEAMSDVLETPLVLDDGELVVPSAPGGGAAIREAGLIPITAA